MGQYSQSADAEPGRRCISAPARPYCPYPLVYLHFSSSLFILFYFLAEIQEYILFFASFESRQNVGYQPGCAFTLFAGVISCT